MIYEIFYMDKDGWRELTEAYDASYREKLIRELIASNECSVIEYRKCYKSGEKGNWVNVK